ncbi:MAG: DUF167 domain-containing protein [Candidatus Cybelea sp.]
MDEIVDVVVKPGSHTPGLSSENGTLVLHVRERAIEGAANDACIRALAEAYGVAPSAVSLVRGFRSRHKRFAIRRPEKPEGKGKSTR